jgi:hypothetical protein
MELATVNAINASLYENLNYDFIRDIVLIAGIGQGPAVMEVNPKLTGTSYPAWRPRRRELNNGSQKDQRSFCATSDRFAARFLRIKGTRSISQRCFEITSTSRSAASLV